MHLLFHVFFAEMTFLAAHAGGHPPGCPHRAGPILKRKEKIKGGKKRKKGKEKKRETLFAFLKESIVYLVGQASLTFLEFPLSACAEGRGVERKWKKEEKKKHKRKIIFHPDLNFHSHHLMTKLTCTLKKIWIYQRFVQV